MAAALAALLDSPSESGTYHFDPLAYADPLVHEFAGNDESRIAFDHYPSGFPHQVAGQFGAHSTGFWPKRRSGDRRGGLPPMTPRGRKSRRTGDPGQWGTDRIKHVVGRREIDHGGAAGIICLD